MEHKRPSGRERDAELAQREAAGRAEAYPSGPRQKPSMRWLAAAGASCMFGVLVMGTVWSLACLWVIDYSASKVVERTMTTSDRVLLYFGPDDESERARYEELRAEQD